MPIGVPGQLFLAGVGLAHGYHNQPTTTARAFLPDPHGDQPGQRRDDAVPHADERRQAPHCRRRARRHGGGDDNSRMPREQPEQFLTGVACCAGHRYAGGGERGAAGARGDRAQDRMHQKVYLYTQARLHSTKIDE